MPNLLASHFAHVFEPLQGKQIGFVRPFGNVGDCLIEKATHQLFDHFQIRWRHWRPGEPLKELQELVFGGGGNMGKVYLSNWKLRGACLRGVVRLGDPQPSGTGQAGGPFVEAAAGEHHYVLHVGRDQRRR